MVTRFISILFIYSAVAILLGHNFCVHHHHLKHDIISHHHKNGHFHFDGHHHNNNDTEDENEDWLHFFSSFQHGEEGLIFLNNHFEKETLVLHLPQCAVPFKLSNCIDQFPFDVRQNSPPYLVKYINSQISLPSGLRAPPIMVV